MAYIGNAPAAGILSGDNIQDGTVGTNDLANSAVTTAKIADGGVHTAKIADNAVSAAKLHTTAVTDKLGYTPVNKAGDTMTGGLSATSLTTSGQLTMSGGGDLSLNRTDGFDMSIVMPSNMDSKALYFQRAGGGNLNQIVLNANNLQANGKLSSNGITSNGYQHGDSTVNALVGNTTGIRTYQQEQGITGGTRTVTIVRRSTDWNDWTGEFMLLTFIAKYYGGGGVGMWYWRIGYGANTLTQIYNVGDLGISLSASGPNQVSGRPSDCQFFDLNCTIPPYYGISIQCTTNLSPVSSITDYHQFKLA